MSDTFTIVRRFYEKDIDQGAIARDFGVYDTKGREFGGHVRLYAATFAEEEIPAERARFWTNLYYRRPREPGVYYTYRPHARRGGKLFGASQDEQYFATEAERDAAVERYFEQAAKRAAKNKARA